ncbi:MAG: response regulator [Roseofilum sp. SBFL]|uniref:ATP-binding protein n=1 Tax=Roseofilum sp. SBFL TaxID=2821496 RepID=UPI001B21B184|nr:ATP-binding protein [Roseofilum sp. SBFL]MBP0044367.1 response regulator [Roseofilum sp. SBFL]
MKAISLERFFNHYSLRHQLLGVFCFIALTPLAGFAWWNYHTMRTDLIESANRSLDTAASQTVVTLDVLIRTNLTAIAIEAQQETFATYLSTPNSILKEQALNSLNILMAKDKVFLVSYALLDINGQNLLDTYSLQIGQNESDRDYFQIALETGEPIVSNIEFSEVDGQPYLYFSQSIRDRQTGEVMGVLRSQYSAAKLQHLILEHENLAGSLSFALLLDDHNLRLAQGYRDDGGLPQELRFQFLAPPESETLQELQVMYRLPPSLPTDLATQLTQFDEFATNFNPDRPYFTTILSQEKNIEYAGAIALSQILPWKVAYLRPKSVFLQPINTQTRNNLILALGTTLAAIGIGFGMANVISSPIRRLTAIARQITDGNLNAHADIVSDNEIGELARTFNTMTGQLRSSIDNLEQRVRERTLELQVAKEEADSANHAKSEFLANMSHELRTPLNGILGYTQILSYTELPTQEQRDGVNIIHQCGTHLLSLINDVLDLSKIEARKLELVPKPLHLPSFLQNLAQMCQIRAELKGLEFIYQTSSRLPESVSIDDKRLRQVLLNLLGNAIKFTERGSVRLLVDVVELSETKANLLVQVRDTGVGIALEDRTKLFEAFEQIGNVQKQAEGTGLGLAISQRIVHLMGGQIKVKSELGQGSEFSFTLDLPLVDDWVQPHRRIKSNSRIIGYQGEHRTILIIDDHWENRAVLSNLLNPLGFTTLEAENGEEGLKMLREQQPDLLITDLAMSVMDGFKLLKHIRTTEDLQHYKIVVSSASVTQADEQKALDGGGDRFLGKPINVKDLFAALSECLHLEWLYEEQEESKFSPKSSRRGAERGDISIPPPEDLNVLIDLALNADLFSICDRLERLDSCYKEFAAPLLELTKEFKIEEVETLLKEYLDQQKE